MIINYIKKNKNENNVLIDITNTYQEYLAYNLILTKFINENNINHIKNELTIYLEIKSENKFKSSYENVSNYIKNIFTIDKIQTVLDNMLLHDIIDHISMENKNKLKIDRISIELFRTAKKDELKHRYGEPQLSKIVTQSINDHIVEIINNNMKKILIDIYKKNINYKLNMACNYNKYQNDINIQITKLLSKSPQLKVKQEESKESFIDPKPILNMYIKSIMDTYFNSISKISIKNIKSVPNEIDKYIIESYTSDIQGSEKENPKLYIIEADISKITNNVLKNISIFMRKQKMNINDLNIKSFDDIKNNIIKQLFESKIMIEINQSEKFKGIIGNTNINSIVEKLLTYRDSDIICMIQLDKGILYPQVEKIVKERLI